MMTLTITNLCKRYGGTRSPNALDRVNLTLHPAIYGLFGRNGAGKTTLMSLIANRLLPSAGTITLDGATVRDRESAQCRIYLVNETLPFMVAARVKAFLKREERYYGGFDWGLASRMLAEFGIDPGAGYGGLSLGQRMVVRLVAALCVPADVLLLDEPVLGLDAANRERFYRFLLASYGERPRVIVMSTHLIDEVAHVVERAVILDRGRVVEEFAAETVGSRAVALVGERSLVDGFVADAALRVVAREALGRMATVTVRGPVEVSALPAGIAATGLGLQDYVIRVTSGAMDGADAPERADGASSLAAAPQADRPQHDLRHREGK